MLDSLKLNKKAELFERLEKESIDYVSRKWSYLNLPQRDDRDAVRRAINDEIIMMCIVDDIEKRSFQVGGKKVLDVGCGIGGLVVAFGSRGAEAIGFDNDTKAIQICKLRSKCYGVGEFLLGDSRYIPFPDDHFDLVTCTSVLEHIKELGEVLREMIRVGKSVYIVVPNPLCPREGHYKILWIPCMPKVLGKAYLTFRGFNPEFFEKRTYKISIFKITRFLESGGMVVTNYTKLNICNKLNNPSLINSLTKRRMASALKLMKLTGLATEILSLLSLSITLVARKRVKVRQQALGRYYPEQYNKRYLRNEADKYLHDLWHPYLIEKIRLYRKKVVFDLGCGTCEFTRQLKGCQLIVGLDLAAEMLRYGARKLLTQKNTHLVRGDAHRLPFSSEVADLILCMGLLEYVDMRPFLIECKRVLKTNGEVMVVFSNRWNLYNLQSRLARKIARRLGREITLREERSNKEVRKAFEDFGLFVKEISCFGMLTPYPSFFQRWIRYLWLLLDKVYGPLQRWFPLGSSVLLIARKQVPAR